MIHQIFRVSVPRIPLSSYQDFSAFKLYAHDVGLLGAMDELRVTDGGIGPSDFLYAAPPQVLL